MSPSDVEKGGKAVLQIWNHPAYEQRVNDSMRCFGELEPQAKLHHFDGIENPAMTEKKRKRKMAITLCLIISVFILAVFLGAFGIACYVQARNQHHDTTPEAVTTPASFYPVITYKSRRDNTTTVVNSTSASMVTVNKPLTTTVFITVATPHMSTQTVVVTAHPTLISIPVVTVTSTTDPSVSEPSSTTATSSISTSPSSPSTTYTTTTETGITSLSISTTLTTSQTISIESTTLTASTISTSTLTSEDTTTDSFLAPVVATSTTPTFTSTSEDTTTESFLAPVLATPESSDTSTTTAEATTSVTATVTTSIEPSTTSTSAMETHTGYTWRCGVPGESC